MVINYARKSLVIVTLGTFTKEYRGVYQAFFYLFQKEP